MLCLKLSLIAFLGILAYASASQGQLRAPSSGKKMVCYFGSWAVYRPDAGKFDVETIDPLMCTHVIYGFTGLKNGQIASLDPWNERCEEYGKGAYLRFTKLKELNPDLKTLIAIGGWNEGSEKYSEMARSSGSRQRFIDSVLPFLEEFNFDGLDLDWEYPANRGGQPEDKENFALLAAELKEAFQPKGYLLTCAVSAGENTIKTAYNIPSMARSFDFINIMAYDFHGAWDKTTGHHAPLYKNPLDTGDFEAFNVNHSVNYWISQGAPREKLILGMGTYGRGVTLNDPNEHGIYAPGDKPISAGPYTREAGFWGYNEICTKIRSESNQWTVEVDPYYKAPYAYNGREWIGYDDPESMRTKAEFARDMGLGGGMVWSLETDDFHGQCHGERSPLIKTIYRIIVGPYPRYEWQPQPPRSSSGAVCAYFRPTWNPQPEPITSTTRAPIITHPSNGNGPPAEATTEAEIVTYPTEAATTAVVEEETESAFEMSSIGPEVSDNSIDETNPTNAPAEDHEICAQEGVNKDPQGDCSKFYICQQLGKSWKVHSQKCPPGTAFDPEIKACNHPQAVEGCSKVKTVSFYRQNSS